eukprot:scaffold85740_cov66-Phaeocystis_antarctica.AAC.3
MYRLQHARRRRLRVAQVCLLLPAVGAGAKGTCARAQQLEPAAPLSLHALGNLSSLLARLAAAPLHLHQP